MGGRTDVFLVVWGGNQVDFVCTAWLGFLLVARLCCFCIQGEWMLGWIFDVRVVGAVQGKLYG